MAIAEIEACSGGGGKNYQDYNIVVGTETKKIPCGFEPKRILMVMSQTNESNGYAYEYDAEVSTTNFSYTGNNKTWYSNGPIETPIPSGWTFIIGEILPDGFTLINTGGGGNVTIHSIIAIG